MRIVYCISDIRNSGGMERITIDKANYLCENLGYEVFIITTDSEDKESFYTLSNKVKRINLNINYSEDYSKNLIKRFMLFLKKNKLHKKRLEKKLREIKADIVISVGTDEKNFLPFLKDGSKKIREFHFGKNYRIENAYNKRVILKIKAYIETKLEDYYLSKYEKVIVLTYEDLKNYKTKNVSVIYNFVECDLNKNSNLKNKKVISVGRLSFQKGYDELIDIWVKVKEKNPDWILEIYGWGEEKDFLRKKIEMLKLEDSIYLKGVFKNIKEKYLESSLYVMTSRYEGLPLVLLEAMSNGVPAISFDCPSGPKDILKNNENGYLIEKRNQSEFSNKINFLIDNEELRKKMGKKAKKDIVEKFNKEKIMRQWIELFEKLKNTER